MTAGAKDRASGVWQTVRLDTVARRGSGHTPDKKHAEYWGGSIKWLSLQDSDRLDRVYIGDTVERITPAGIANSSAVEHPPGSVVMSRDAGVGKSAITTDIMAVSQHFMAWQCGPRLDKHFLYYWLQSMKPEFERIAAGNTIKTIGLPYFRALEIPLPPLAEQRAIATALSDFDKLLAGLDRLLAKKRDLKQAAMQQLLTGMTRLPGYAKRWSRQPLGELAELSIGGTPSRANKALWGPGHPWLTIADLKCKIVTSSAEEITGQAARAMSIVPKGTLLMSFKLSLGRRAIAGCDVFTNEAICAVLRPRAEVEYLYYALARVDFSKYGKQAVKGVTLNSESLRSIVVDLPDREEQAAIADVLGTMDSELATLEARLEKTRLLKQAMMQELLTGRTRLV